MTGPSFTPQWSDEDLANRDFERVLYSDRMKIDDITRTDLVNRRGEPVKIIRAEAPYAHGQVLRNGEWLDITWYYSPPIHDSLLKRDHHSLAQHGDSPGLNDVMLPKENRDDYTIEVWLNGEHVSTERYNEDLPAPDNLTTAQRNINTMILLNLEAEHDYLIIGSTVILWNKVEALQLKAVHKETQTKTSYIEVNEGTLKIQTKAGEIVGNIELIQTRPQND